MAKKMFCFAGVMYLTAALIDAANGHGWIAFLDFAVCALMLWLAYGD